MNKITINLSQKSTLHKTLQNELGQFLSSLEHSNYSKNKVPIETGSLGGTEIIQFVVESGGDILSFVTALIMLYQQVKSSNPDSAQNKKTDSKEKDMTIEITGVKLELPASPATQKGFIKLIDPKPENKKKKETQKAKTGTSKKVRKRKK